MRGPDDHVARLQDGIQLISPDRPGIGLSDPVSGRTILDWARDIGELVDQIDVDRFAVMGGQYAAAVGHALARRVTRVAIIAGALPLTDPGAFEELPLMDRVYTQMSQRVPWLARHCFGAMRYAAQRAPRQVWPPRGARTRVCGRRGHSRRRDSPPSLRVV